MIPVAEVAEGLRALEEGRLDAYASDRLLLAGLLATAKNPAKLRLSAEYFSYEPYGAHDASRGQRLSSAG